MGILCVWLYCMCVCMCVVYREEKSCAIELSGSIRGIASRQRTCPRAQEKSDRFFVLENLRIVPT